MNSVRDVEVTPERLEALAKIAGISIPEVDRNRLLAALKDHLTAMASLEAAVDVYDAQPIVQLDPRWK